MLTPEVTERTRAERAASAVHGLVAEQEDHLAGLAHLVLYPTTWATHPTYYLEDPLRRQAVARRRRCTPAHRGLRAFADGFGPASVYWLTQEYNVTARSPYDTLAHRTSFVVYQR